MRWNKHHEISKLNQFLQNKSKSFPLHKKNLEQYKIVNAGLTNLFNFFDQKDLFVSPHKRKIFICFSVLSWRKKMLVF
jgi:hypothetical protein